MVQLTPDEIRLKDSLIEKFNRGPLEVSEAEQLISLLQKERKKALELGDVALLFGTAVLLGVLIDYVSSKKSFWRKLFK